MNTQEKTALESLLAKLSSLRKTLSDEERQVLDAMVTKHPIDEVSLHSVPTEGAVPPKPEIPVEDESEVSLHSVPIEGAVPPKPEIPVEDESEVSLHSVPTEGAVPPKPEIPVEDESEVSLHSVPQGQVVIIFDPETETYRAVGKTID